MTMEHVKTTAVLLACAVIIGEYGARLYMMVTQ